MFAPKWDSNVGDRTLAKSAPTERLKAARTFVSAGAGGLKAKK
jgi:hypothetical protein